MKCTKKLYRIVSLSVLVVLCSFGNTFAAKAITDMEAGLDSFKKHDYKTALAHFTQAIKNNPGDCNALYYEAITLHQLKEMSLAKQAYAAIILRFPGTQAARNAQAALSYLDPNYMRQFQQQISSMAGNMANGARRSSASSGQSYNYSASTSATSSLPAQARVPYQKEGQHLIVRAYINNRPVDMLFDSGASTVVFTKGQLENAGISVPQGKPTGQSFGVGSGGAQSTWTKQVDLKVGQIERKNFPVTIQDVVEHGISYPLLGESFFRDFSYTIESSPDLTRGTILFQKKGTAAAFGQDSSVIPYKDAGQNMLVSVDVNGRTVLMYFDTGAGTCCFSRKQWQSMGFSVPDDAQPSKHSGIAGATEGWDFTVPRMRLGSVTKLDVPVSVLEHSDMDYPLLGNTFLGDLRIDIDNSAHIMRIRR